ncbi:putative cation-transporting ATPase 13A3 [Phytophthora fragariae]|uniref:Putative cation-transporting ATPase 13A3 n=1 Tax=Phytophthora fragariae TaxID=53985 RepID=A0A6A3ZJJ2_9STRA|nr:putative cation-transporting ATPase 13A3 [Phytophthora fragariae]KAE8937760.1 putative cation-transporting ATPase 13A3 [Phytophthora fragariae]KAE9011734.1 putative cation-transporting ATPase 13A3 [Phytophthora fragariae]KAE9104456.1 putative cation-transporting ATPase 13A3 [Phytophthora fragariae]KAE9113426.1 putative cation-transporting ATPase 13A3 [Phytophthora fragariae]
MPRWSSVLLPTLALAALAPAQVRGAAANQMDFAACPVRHSPEYYCCEYSETTKVLYTKYNRPSGGGYESYYVDGWNKQRQVNYPYTMYHPSTQAFYYNEPNTMCRVQDVVNTETGELTEQLQCADTNSSLAADSQDSTVFWTYAANVRNNNASFPVGAQCYSIMLRDGMVDADIKEACTSQSTTSTPRFTTFTETPLVIIYLLYLLFFIILGSWTVFKSYKQKANKSVNEMNKKLIATPQTPLRAVAGNAHGRHTSVRASDTRMQIEAAEEILQTGFSNSVLGSFVFGCVVVASLALNVLLIIIIADYYGNFDPPLFDITEDNALVFIIVWVITSIWFVIIVSMQDSIFNFFRLRVPLEDCEYVYMLKRDDTEVLLADRSGVSDFVAKVESFFASKGKISGYRTTVPVMEVDGLRIVEFQHLRYVYEETEQRFVPGAVALGRTYNDMLQEASGLSESEARHRINTVGRNSVDVEMPSLPVSMAHEFFTLFYIYQIMCYYVWYYFTYWNMGIVMTVVVLGAAVVNIYTQRQIQSSIVQMTRYRTDVTVFRDGQWRELSSPDIAPGDLVKVSENWLVPCDMAIVKGTTVCDESMLTGESMPVQKFPIPERSTDVYDPEKGSKKHTLFAGTRVLSSGRNEEILAIVQTTGAHTTKGQLIQSILFPIPMRFKYNEHLKVLISLLLIYAVIACILVINFLLSNGKLSNRYAAFCYAIFMLSCVISPLLPVVITVGQVNASQRLEKLGIFSLNVQRITLCGKVRIFCFDKTGTLTKQGLDFLGVQPVKDCRFTPIVNNVKDAPSAEELLYALSTCHSVGSLEDRLVGNEVEVRMFTSTGWELVEKEGEQPCVKSKEEPGLELEFIKRYDFDHHRMSMSVVVRNRKSGKYYVFCKGSYERMQQLSSAASVPDDYKSVADRLAKDGCYVLGLSYRELPSDWTHEQVVAFADNREAVDENLSLLGLILFRNELKYDTADAIAKLKGGDIRTVMITGDNAMCGCYIARKSGMVASSSRVILGEMVSTKEMKKLVWRDVDSEEEYDLPGVKHLVAQGEDVELAVTGVAFDYLVSMGEIKGLLLNIRIFSRMTPDGKVECVKLHMETGAVTGMCGDGGNDCGALRFAHAGVALSDAEASVVSPFTSREKTIQSVVDLCREGRCSLATSFASVKFLIMYGLIGSVLRLFMYYHVINLSQWCWILVEGFMLVGCSYVITLSKPLDELKDMRPTSSLIGPTTLVSILGQEAINIIYLACSIHMLSSEVWYCPFSPDNVDVAKWWLMSDNHLATVLFFAVIFQQHIAAWVFSFGSQYRQPIWRNYLLLTFIAAVTTLDLYLLLGEPSIVTDRFRIASSTNVVGLPDIPMPMSFRLKYLGMILGNIFTCILFEYVVVLGPVRSYFRNKYHTDLIPMKK